MENLKYNASFHPDFQKALKNNIRAYFEETNQHQKGNSLLAFKVVFFLIWMLAGYYILYTAKNFPETLLGFMLSGTGSLFIVITAGHDASHKAFSRKKWVNKVFSHSWLLLGLSTYLWEAKHHHSHHGFTNIINYDQDISQTNLLRMNPKDKYLWFHRFQKYYAFLLYIVFGFFAVTYREFKLYSIREYGNTTSRHGIGLLFGIILIKIFYFTVNMVIPLLLIPIVWWQVVLCFLIMLSFLGIYMALVLVIPHINRRSIFKEPSPDGVMQTDWFTHAIEVTVDASPASKLANWFTGGLNTHVVHHLFPNICHIHYYKLTPVVAKTAEEFGLAYKKEGFWSLVMDHFRLLGEFGDSPSKGEKYLMKISS